MSSFFKQPPDKSGKTPRSAYLHCRLSFILYTSPLKCKENKMDWLVIDTVIQPSNGITFSAIWCNIKLIIWYQSDVFLPPDSIFTPVYSGIRIGSKELPITIYNVSPFNKKLWELIKNNKGCPTESDQIKDKCTNHRCILTICPYGRK